MPITSPIDAELLNLLQKQVPLVPAPFAAVGQQVGLSEAETLEHLIQLKSPPQSIIRQISGIFDTQSLGYQSSLVAAKIDPTRIEQAAQIINQHPGVTHNYQRNHDYNLWYTLAVPPDSKLGLQATADILHRRSGALATRLLPTLKLYKIGVSFDLSGEGDAPQRTSGGGFTQEKRQHAMSFALTEQDKAMIRVLQQDLPLVARPFDGWAQQAGVSVEQLLSTTQIYLDRNWMRRFSAVLHHRQAGFSANGMGVWAVPPEQCDSFGALAASYAAVSHCYLRPTYEDWPYSIFTMIHGTSEAQCQSVVDAIAQQTGAAQHQTLFSSRQFKKVRLRYFEPDIAQWEAQASHQ